MLYKCSYFYTFVSVYLLLFLMVIYNDVNYITYTFIILSINTYILLSLLFFKNTFEEKYPLLFKLLIILCLIIMIICIIILCMELYNKLGLIFNRLNMKYKIIKKSKPQTDNGPNNTGGPNKPDKGPESPPIPRKKYRTDEEKAEARKEAQRKYRLKTKLQTEAYNAERRPPRVVSEESKENKRIYNASEKGREQRRKYIENKPDKQREYVKNASTRYRAKKRREKEVEKEVKD